MVRASIHQSASGPLIAAGIRKSGAGLVEANARYIPDRRLTESWPQSGMWEVENGGVGRDCRSPPESGTSPLCYSTMAMASDELRNHIALESARFGDRRAAGERVLVTALSSRDASSSNEGVGPHQRNWSTSSKSAMSARSVASVRNSIACSRSRERVSASGLALATFTCHSRQSAGIDSRCPNFARTAAADFAPQPGSPG